VVDLSDPRRPAEVASFVPPPSPARQTAATAQGGRRDMPLVWGVTRWNDLVLASDMNSGLWVIRVTHDGKGSSQGGSGGGSGRQPPPAPQAAPGTDPAGGEAAPGGWGAARWTALAGLALGLLAAGAVTREALRRRRGS
jgi:hypothetical protein